MLLHCMGGLYYLDLPGSLEIIVSNCGNYKK